KQSHLPPARAPANAAALPAQEPGARPARALPYTIDASMGIREGTLVLTIVNSGAAGAAFILYPASAPRCGPWFYTGEARKSWEDRLPQSRAYALTLHGPNGFLRAFRGGANDRLEIASTYDPAGETLRLSLRNRGDAPLTVKTTNAYVKGDPRVHKIAPGGL